MFKQRSGVLEKVRDDCKYLYDSGSPSVTHDVKSCPSPAPLTPECCPVVDIRSIAPSTVMPEDMSHAMDGNASDGEAIGDRCYPEIDKILGIFDSWCSCLSGTLATVLSSATSLQKVWLNGILVEVRKNLHDALEALYATCNGNQRSLWIDALCINQINLLERNHQVQMMGSIYVTARRVLVWLGRPSVDIPDDMAVSRSFSKMGAAGSSPGFGLVRSAIRFLGHWNFDNEKFKTTFGLAYPYHNGYLHHWEHLAELCNIGYWSRIWIVQEVGLARTIHILFGFDVLEWDAFSSLRQWLDNNSLGSSVHEVPRRLDEAINSIKDSMPAHLDRQWIYPRLVPSFESLLLTCRYSICQDPRDKIYGLLGLAKDVSEGDICIDYQQTPLELYESVLCYYLSKPFHQDSCLRLEKSQRNVARFNQLVLQILQSGSQKLNSLDSSIEKFLRTSEGTRRLFKIDASDPEKIEILHKWNLPSELTIRLPILNPRTQTPVDPPRWKEERDVNTEKLSAVLDIGGYSELRKLVPFMAANGDIGLAPDCIRATDSLCRLVDCNGAAVIVRAMDSKDGEYPSFRTICRSIVGKRLSHDGTRTDPPPSVGIMPKLGLRCTFSLFGRYQAYFSSTAFHAITRSYDWGMLNEYEDLTRISRESLPKWRQDLHRHRTVIPSKLESTSNYSVFAPLEIILSDYQRIRALGGIRDDEYSFGVSMAEAYLSRF
ncbi:hypothetical protein BP5796_07901 [Coleophoma crateriformis]|uniref:Heterokaryon incompatibility domain-containing protein n=1 Tax=Coleophoma crateriformis TaxID=565419 RepID=A0A3D8RCT7_9HELO|nr:hypothetical protein BP5796_07901 [Coleophoma crateriformis]